MDKKTATNTVLIHSNRNKYSVAEQADKYLLEPPPLHNLHPSPQPGSFHLNDKDDPELIAAACIISTGGMSMAWGLGFNGVSNVAETTYMDVCWFAMVIAGAFFNAILANALRKKVHLLMSSVLVVIGGILFISLYDNFEAIMAARHINGFTVGWILVTTFVMAGEQAAKEVRPVLISTAEAVYFSLGIVVQIVCSSIRTKYINFDSNQMHGIMVLFFGFTAFVVIMKQTIESPQHLLKKNPEQLELDKLLLLDRPCMISVEERAQIEDYKEYLASSASNETGTLSALLKLCLLRGIIGLSFTAVVVKTLQFTSIAALFYQRMEMDEFESIEKQAKIDLTMTVWPLVVYGVSRLSGTYIGSLLQDCLGSKLTLTIAMFFSGVMAIAIAIFFNDLGFYLFYPSKMLMALIFLFIYQFFTGVCITSSSTYLTEAFPVAAKPYCIAIVLTIEMIVFIIFGSFKVTFCSISQYFYALGTISFAFVGITVLCLPETRRTTLREALQKFENIIDTKFN